MKIRAFQIPDTMYNNTILLYYGGSYADFNKLMVKRFKETPDNEKDACSGMSVTYKTSEGNAYIIWAESWGQLLHEFFHCAMQILKDQGIVYHHDSNDTHAYFLQHIYGNAILTLKKHKIKGIL